MSEKGKILLVDDDADFLRSTADLLEAHGYKVISAFDGASGFEKARREQPDLMVLDVMMASKTEGFEVARKITQSPELRRMPVLLVTGVRRDMNLGFRLEPDATWLPVDRILEKPIDPAEFIAAVEELLRKREGMDWKHGSLKMVRDLLAARVRGSEVWTIGPEATVFEASEIMGRYRVGALPVVKDGRLIGICSERDFARKVILEGRPSKTTTVADIMTRQVIYVTLDQTVDECMALMTHKYVRHLPVMEGEKLVGIISIGDVVRAVIREKQFLIEQLERYITSG